MNKQNRKSVSPPMMELLLGQKNKTEKNFFYLLRLLIGWNRSQQPVVILDYLHMSDLFSRQTSCADDWHEKSEVLSDLTFGRRENKQNPDCIGGDYKVNEHRNQYRFRFASVGWPLYMRLCRLSESNPHHFFFSYPPMLVGWSIFPDVNGVLFRPQVAKKWLTALSIRGGAVG